MSKRVELHEKLVEILGSRLVYFQPPETVRIAYPCIIYSLDRIDMKYANDKPYFSRKRYNITIIDKDPDSELPDKIKSLPLCSFNRFYTATNLNHWVFTLYF